MENVDKTIDSICNWIQKELEDDSNLKTDILPEMTKALAALVEASSNNKNVYKDETCCLTKEIPIYIEATKQNTFAKMKLESLYCHGSITDWIIATLYDVENLKPFTGISKVRTMGKEMETYMKDGRTLIQTEGKPIAYWMNKKFA